VSESILSARACRTPRAAAVPLVFLLALPIFLKLTFPFEAVSRRWRGRRSERSRALHRQPRFERRLRREGARPQGARSQRRGRARPELVLERVAISPDVFGMLAQDRLRLRTSTPTAEAPAATLGFSNDPRRLASRTVLDASELDLKALRCSSSPARRPSQAGLEDEPHLAAGPEEANGTVSLAQERGGAQGHARARPRMNFRCPRCARRRGRSISIEKGLAKIEKLTARNGDIEADLDGTIRLKPLLQVSEANLRVRLKFADKWLEANPLVKAARLPGPKQATGYWITLTGPLTRLVPKPGK